MSDYLYEIALMGEPSDEVVAEIKILLKECLELFELTVGVEVGLTVGGSGFNPSQERGAAVAFFGAVGASDAGISQLLSRGVSVIPVASNFEQVAIEIPESLRKLNCLSYQTNGALRIVTALLEYIGLLPRQRRVFLSYRRNESREAALQLFDQLSARNFEVFLDTHGIGPAVNFQAALWHQLCDSDVLVMLDTPGYFESRWTEAELGRALVKGIMVLRIGWPDVEASKRLDTAKKIELQSGDVDPVTGRLINVVITEICNQVESLRSQSYAVRNLNLFSKVNLAVEEAQGEITGGVPHQNISATLPRTGEVVIFPTVGIPTSLVLNNAENQAPGEVVAVVYDEIGIHKDSLNHISWLNEKVGNPCYIKVHRAAWDFSDWEVSI